MRFSITALTLIIVARTSALPSKRQTSKGANIDADILQYALTLEHLENAFYTQAVDRWPRQAFVDAGFSPKFYDELKYIAHDEEGHVLYLQSGLKAAGVDPVEACEYRFPMTDPRSFVALASIIEGVGVSAYLGAAADITSKAYLTAGGAILVTEALHQSSTRGAIGKIPMANLVGTPMSLSAVFSIASQFIVSCPLSNAPLPVRKYPSLQLLSGQPTAENAFIDLLPEQLPTGTFYVTFVSGLDIFAVEPSSIIGKTVFAVVPMGASGQSYVFVTKDKSGNLSDDNILFGPAIIEVTPDAPTWDVEIE